MDKGDYVKFRAFLDINWDDVLDVSNNTIDEMWERFKQIILEGTNNFIPRGSKRINKKKNYQPFTSELKQLIHKNTDFGIDGFHQGTGEFIKSIKKFVIKLRVKQLGCLNRNNIEFLCYVKKNEKILAVY